MFTVANATLCSKSVKSLDEFNFPLISAMIKIISWDWTDNFPISKTENDNNNKFVVGKFHVKCQLLYSYLGSDTKFPQVNERPPFLGEISCQMPDNYIITGI